MSTMIAGTAPAGLGQPPAIDPAAVVARTHPRVTIAETISQTLTMAWREL